MLVVKQVNGSREYDSTMWNEYTCGMPTSASRPPSSPQSTWACAPGTTSNRRCKPTQRIVVGLSQLGRDPRADLGQEHLDPLIVAGEAMLGDQPLMHNSALQRDIGAEPVLDQLDKRVDQPGLTTHPGRRRRRRRRRVLGQILAHRPPVTAALAADLDIAGARFVQGAETTNVHPGLRIQDHEQVPFGLVCLAADEPKGDPHSGGRRLNAPRPTSPTHQVVRRTTYEVVRGHLPTPRRAVRGGPRPARPVRPNRQGRY